MCSKQFNEKDRDIISHILNEVDKARAEVDEGESITFLFKDWASANDFGVKLTFDDNLRQEFLREITNLGIDEDDIRINEEGIRIAL